MKQSIVTIMLWLIVESPFVVMTAAGCYFVADGLFPVAVGIIGASFLLQDLWPHLRRWASRT